SLMALSSSRSWRYNVFLSFHGPDVRSSYLSHLRKQVNEADMIEKIATDVSNKLNASLSRILMAWWT
ncbi:hypothetical protein HID58_095250, partial [Brassica napus]